MSSKAISYFLTMCVAVGCTLISAVPLESSGPTNCANVRNFFLDMKFSTSPPAMLLTSEKLTTCDGSRTCCTTAMENDMKSSAKRDYRSILHQNYINVQNILQATSAQVEEYVLQMLQKEEKKTTKVFHDVFSDLAQSANQFASTFFKDLIVYFKDKQDLTMYLESPHKQMKLSQIPETFFAKLFPSAFEMSFSPKLKSFPPDYYRCLETKIDEIKPFGDHSVSFSRDLTKTLEAAKVFTEALRYGAEFLNSTDTLITSNDGCSAGFFKMSGCSKCSGFLDTKPCVDLCLNVMRGCLSQPASMLDGPWASYYQALDKLSGSLFKGQNMVGLEDLLRTLHSRIAEATLYFGKQSANIRNKVKFICGQIPKWTRNSEVESDASEELGVVPGITVSTKVPGSHPEWNVDDDDVTTLTSALSSKMTEFQLSVSTSRTFHMSMADFACKDKTFVEIRDSAPCWNGEKVAEYLKHVIPSMVTSQKQNPEVPWSQDMNNNHNNPGAIQLLEDLQNVKQVILTQTAPTSGPDTYLIPNEEGSGSDDMVYGNTDQWNDDEDADQDWKDQGSGSGDMPPVTILPDAAVEPKILDDPNLKTSPKSSTEVTTPPSESFASRLSQANNKAIVLLATLVAIMAR